MAASMSFEVLSWRLSRLDARRCCVSAMLKRSTSSKGLMCSAWRRGERDGECTRKYTLRKSGYVPAYLLQSHQGFGVLAALEICSRDVNKHLRVAGRREKSEHVGEKKKRGFSISNRLP